MPPSGYSRGQARYIDSFLRSCASALHAEAMANGESLLDALDRELADIARYSQKERITPAQLATIKLTSCFYGKVRRLFLVCSGLFYWCRRLSSYTLFGTVFG